MDMKTGCAIILATMAIVTIAIVAIEHKHNERR